MANITIQIPDAVLQRVLDAFAGNYNWTDQLGVTKAQFARQKVQEFIKENVKAFEAQKAAEEARQTAITTVESEIVLS